MLVFVALDWVRVDPSSIHAPRWVLGVCGAIFAVPGMASIYYGVANGRAGDARERDRTGGDFPVVSWLAGLVIAGGLTAVASWVAFGPGERAFSGSVNVGPVGVGGSGQSETLSRWVFGLGAVVCGLFTVWALVHGLRRIAGKSDRGDH